MSPLAMALWSMLAASKVSDVVVYPDRAQVIRSEAVACSGVTPVLFEHIPPSADPASFRAKVEGGEIEGLTAEDRPAEEGFGPERKAAEQKMRALSLEIRQLQEQEALAQTREQVAAQYVQLAAADVGREMYEPKPNTQGWAAALDTAASARLASAAEVAALSTKLARTRQHYDDTQRKLASMAEASPRAERRATVLVRCQGGTAKVELSYVVGGASWQPWYEARADEKAGAVELTTFANVRQSTGEDWKGAHVVLSTAVPSDEATPPEIRPLKISAFERKIEKRVLVRRDEYREHAESGEGAQTQAQGQLRPASQGLSVQLEVPEPADVPGNGNEARLAVGTSKLGARFSLRTYPKLQPLVFKVAEAVNTGPWPLLPGTVDAYGRSGFLGRYPLERTAQGAPLRLSFGPDERFKVERRVVLELAKAEGLFGSSRRFRYGYRFDVENHRPQAETLELAEHIPVSELDDVTVQIEDATTQGYELRKEDGIVTWKVKLAPGEKKRLDLAFHVDVPSSYDSGGL